MRALLLPRSASLAQAALAILILAHSAPAGPPEGPGRPERTGFEVECPRCGLAGRISCATCGGTGSLRKPCSTCAGKGRRRCPQCAPPTAGSRAPVTGSGKIPCTACSGKGALDAAPDRVCFRCKGARELPCPVCFGKGDLSCSRTRHDRTCPTCAFVGTVPCPDCRGGEDPVGAQQAAQAARKGPAPAAANSKTEEPPPAAPDSAAQARALAAEKTAEKYEVERKAASESWNEVDRRYLELKSLVSRVPGGEIRRARTALQRLHREAVGRAGEGKAEAGELAGRIREAQNGVESLDRSWEKVEEQFERLEKYHGLASRLREPQPDGSLDQATGDSEEAREKLALLNQWLTLARLPLAALEEETLKKLALEIKGASAAGGGFRQALDKMKSAPLRGGPKKPGQRPPPGPEAGPEASPGASPDDGAVLVEAYERGDLPGAEVQPSAARRALEASSRAEALKRPATNRGKPDRGRPPGTGGMPLKAVAVSLGLLAIAVCAALYLFLERRQ